MCSGNRQLITRKSNGFPGFVGVLIRYCGWLAALLLMVMGGPRSLLAQDKAAKPIPDVIIFTNGDQLSGQLVRQTGKSVVFKSDMAGEVKVTVDQIRELRSSGSFALLRNDVPVMRASVETGTVSIEDGDLTIANPSAEPLTIPVARISYLIDQATYDKDVARKPGARAGWNGTFSAGGSLVRATQNNQTFTGSVALVRSIPTVPWLPPKNRTIFDANEAYGKVTQVGKPYVKTNIFHGVGERDEYFSPRFYALAQSTFDHNFSQGLDLSQTYGAGIGLTIIQRPMEQLDVKTDVHYLKQQFQTPASDKDLIGSTFAEAYRRSLPRRIMLNQQLSLIPAWNNLSAYSAAASANLTLPVYKRFSLAVGTIDNFLNNPAVGFKKNSFQFTTGLTYTLH